VVPQPSPANDPVFLSRIVEATVRVGVLVVLVAWCLQIVWPFVVPLIWGIIIAIAAHPIYHRLQVALGGRRKLAATIFTLLALILLIGPTILLAETLIVSAQELASDLRDGTVVIPVPPESIGQWPVIGQPLERFWRLASVNLEQALGEIGPQLRALASWLLSTVAGVGLGILQFVFAIITAGVLLTQAQPGRRVADAIATRLAGDRGAELADLAHMTIRSVTRGILGVALIQALLAGLGFLAVGLPAAGFLALICLLLAMVQSILIVLLPTVIYVFATADPVVAAVFLIWSLFVGLIDNVLKPILLGRGVKAPMIVIFLGAIGGFLASGVIGLFVGAVVLALGYELFLAWLYPGQPLAEEQAKSWPSPPTSPPSLRR
jgi:predicted PurR-regulated permease PerM